MNNEMTMKDKRFSFFADPQERKAESKPTFGILPFAQHPDGYGDHCLVKVKEPYFAYMPLKTIMC